MTKPIIAVTIHEPLKSKLFSAADVKRLNALGDVRWYEGTEPLKGPSAIEFLAGCNVGVGSWGTPRPDAEVVTACPDLRLWEHVAGSVTAMFGPHLDGRNIVIGSCMPAIAECVAQMVVGEMVIGLKRLFDNASANRTGKSPAPTNAMTMFDATTGIVGASLVGRETIRFLKPFEPRILLYDPFVSGEEAGKLGVTLESDLLKLCAASDVVSLHTPLLPATRKLLGAREFRAMRDDAVFINTARGGCVDEAALIAELEKGRLFAFIDVTEPEPAADDNPLRRLPNVVLTSHIAGMPDRRLGKQAVDDIIAFLGGGMPRRVVTADMVGKVA